MTAKCPDCKHPITEHAEFFCMHINCMCNTSRNSAQAKYERDLMKKRLDIAIDALTEIRGKAYPNGIPHSIAANEALEKIGEIV